MISVAKDIILGGEATTFSILKDGTAPLLNVDSWSYPPYDIFPDTCDNECIGELSNLASKDSKVFGNCYEGTESMDVGSCGIYHKRGADTNRSLYHFPLDDISPTDGDLDLFGTGHENHESSYLSYEGWPDTSYTGKFDELFRFGQENAINGDEMSWFSSSSQAIDTSRDASESGFKSFFSETSALTTLNHHETDIYDASSSLLPHSDENISPSSYSTLVQPSYINCVGVNGERKPEFVSGMQPDNLRRKLLKTHRQKEGKREDQTSKYASGGSCLIPGTAEQFANPTERFSDSSQNVIALTTKQSTEKLQWNCQMQDLLSNKFQQEDSVNHSPFTEEVPPQKQLHQTQDGIKGHSRVEKVITEHPNLDTDSSVILDCSGISSARSNKITAEETSFWKLHYVLEQLDIRTKLCIRDSLYRLAKSAEQRNVMGHPSGNVGDGRDQSGLVATEESNRFVDMETDTNPIDRSIAHLLFHRPNGKLSVDPNFIIE